MDTTPSQSCCPQCNLVYDTWKMINCRRYSPTTGYICVPCRDRMRSIRYNLFYTPPDHSSNSIDLPTNSSSNIIDLTEQT